MLEESDGLSETSRLSLLPVGIAVIALFVTLYIVPLNTRPMFFPDETRYAEIPWEMVFSGDWMTLEFAGVQYFEKPPLGYWLNAISISVFGHNAFAARLPTALSAGFVALLLYFLVRRVRKDANIALLTSIVYLSMLLVFGVGTFAVLDSMFTLFATLSMALYYVSTRREGRRRIAWSAASGAACGLAFLTKGFTVLVIAALTLFAWSLWERRYRRLLTDWIVPVAAAFLVVLPVAVMLHRNNPDFWNYFVWVEHVQRFVNPSSGQHAEPLWYYVPVVLFATVPWCLFLPAAAPGIYRKARSDAFSRFCVAWFFMPLFFLSYCGGKLITYILPCLPPFAILMAEALISCPSRTLLRRCAQVGSGVFLVAMGGFFGWLFWGSDGESLRMALLSGTDIIFLSVSVLLLVLCLWRAGYWLGVRGGKARGLAWVGLSMCAMCFSAFHFLPEPIEDNKSPDRLFVETMPLTPENAVFITDRSTLPSACWHYKRTDIPLFLDTGELRYGMERAEEWRLLRDYAATASLVRKTFAEGRPLAVYFRERYYQRFMEATGNPEPARYRKRSTYIWALFLPPDVSVTDNSKKNAGT